MAPLFVSISAPGSRRFVGRGGRDAVVHGRRRRGSGHGRASPCGVQYPREPRTSSPANRRRPGGVVGSRRSLPFSLSQLVRKTRQLRPHRKMGGRSGDHWRDIRECARTSLPELFMNYLLTLERAVPGRSGRAGELSRLPDGRRRGEGSGAHPVDPSDHGAPRGRLMRHGALLRRRPPGSSGPRSWRPRGSARGTIRACKDACSTVT